MATYADLIVPVEDIIGADYDPRRTAVHLETNTPNSLIVVDGTTIRAGGRREKLGSSGTVTFPNLVTTNSASNPTVFAYRVQIVYAPLGSREQKVWTSSDFPLTATANLAAISEAFDGLAIAPTWQSDFRDEMEAIRAEAAASAALADSYIVADLNTSDGQMEALIESPSSLTKAALSATYARRYRPDVFGCPLWVRGTSYDAGSNAAAGYQYHEIVGAQLGSTVTHNSAMGGSNTPTLPYQFMDDAAPNGGKWTPGTSTGLVLIGAGIGEALSERTGIVAQSRLVFEECVKFALRFHRASEFRKGDHASISLGAGWATETISTSVTPMTPGLASTTANAIVTFTPGGPSEICIITAAWNRETGEGNNSDYEVSIDGGPWLKGTTKGRGDTRLAGGYVAYTFGSIRITGLAPTSNVRVKKTGPDKLWLNGYLVMDNPTPPGIVLVQNVYLRGARLAVPTGLGTANVGTAGSTQRYYSATAFDAQGRETEGSALATPNNTNATLDATNYVNITCTPVVGASGYNWYRYDGTSFRFIGSSVLPAFSDKGAPDGQSTGPAINETSVGPWQYDPSTGILTDPNRCDATIDAYRAIIRKIAASPEFADGTVVVADPNPRFRPALHLATDQVHPNNDGHAVIAEAVIAAAQSLVTS